MKALLLCLVGLFAYRAAAQVDTPAPDTFASWSLAPGGRRIAAADKPWSVVGPWVFIHTNW